ncbi:MAG: restriction endonuclease subunit S [Gemmatimonas sp.]|jgi:type I restriction enzyme S subunit|uniref:restriction endonuclease subunit S n=1 Tax=Gemmatimonas sp. TaxID=1962908 RepID=UPI0022BFEC00|nr:restriction endonuclease subunit S [Gemmatimonas sp.]MCZ8013837.1 restriction endonuclease subunit S [Gemmatimonas sp.]MCZ8268085.1 restriction endonuclease subunit S [Gemmatimonas sp.]
MSFPRYPEYKDSGLEWLGQVPAHWRLMRLKHVLEFSTGWTPPTNDASSFEGDNRWANISDLGERVVTDTAKRISDDAVASAGIKPAEPGNLLYSFKLSIGQVSFAGAKMYTNEAIATFSPSDLVDLRFAYYALPFLLEKNAAENIYGAKLLNQALIRSALLLLPPLREQVTVADFLDHESAKIDALVAEQERLIALLKEKRQSVISHAVTKGLNPDVPMKYHGTDSVTAIPAHWQVMALNRLIRQGTTITYGIVQAGPDVEGGVPYIRTSDMSGDSLREGAYLRTSYEIDRSYSRSKVEEGELVVAIRASVGKALIVPRFLHGANLTQGTARVSPGDRVKAEYLALFFRSDFCQGQIQQVSKGTTFQEITLDALRKLPIIVPPMHEQLEIVDRIKEQIDVIDSLQEESERIVEILAERRSALITAAVTGQIDVRGIAHAEAA